MPPASPSIKRGNSISHIPGELRHFLLELFLDIFSDPSYAEHVSEFSNVVTLNWALLFIEECTDPFTVILAVRLLVNMYLYQTQQRVLNMDIANETILVLARTLPRFWHLPAIHYALIALLFQRNLFYVPIDALFDIASLRAIFKPQAGPLALCGEALTVVLAILRVCSRIGEDGSLRDRSGPGRSSLMLIEGTELLHSPPVSAKITNMPPSFDRNRPGLMNSVSAPSVQVILLKFFLDIHRRQTETSSKTCFDRGFIEELVSVYYPSLASDARRRLYAELQRPDTEIALPPGLESESWFTEFEDESSRLSPTIIESVFELLIEIAISDVLNAGDTDKVVSLPVLQAVISAAPPFAQGLLFYKDCVLRSLIAELSHRLSVEPARVDNLDTLSASIAFCQIARDHQADLLDRGACLLGLVAQIADIVGERSGSNDFFMLRTKRLESCLQVLNKIRRSILLYALSAIDQELKLASSISYEETWMNVWAQRVYSQYDLFHGDFECERSLVYLLLQLILNPSCPLGTSEPAFKTWKALASNKNGEIAVAWRAKRRASLIGPIIERPHLESTLSMVRGIFSYADGGILNSSRSSTCFLPG